MQWYAHYIAAFRKDCSTLTLAQEGAYRRLMDWAYEHEAPLPLAFADLARITVCTTRAERDAVRFVVEKFFQREADGYHQKRVDQTVIEYQEGHVSNGNGRASQLDASKKQSTLRQQRYQDRKNIIAQTLRAHGYDARANMPIGKLAEVFQQASDTSDFLTHLTSDSDASDLTIKRNKEITTSASTLASVGARGRFVIHPSLAPAAEAAAEAIRQAGFPEATTADPALVVLVTEGCTVHEFNLAATEAAARHKPLAWAYARVAGQRQDALRLGSRVNGGTPAAEAPPSRSEAAHSLADLLAEVKARRKTH